MRVGCKHNKAAKIKAHARPKKSSKYLAKNLLLKFLILFFFSIFIQACKSYNLNQANPPTLNPPTLKPPTPKPAIIKARVIKLEKAIKKPHDKINNTKCKKRALHIVYDDKTTILQLLQDLASECDFHVVIKDELARKKLNQNTPYPSLAKMSLARMIKLLISEQNMSYDFTQNILRIQALNTVIFKLSYISSIRLGQSVVRASVDATPRQSDEGEAPKDNDNLIKSTESNDFYTLLEKNLKALLNSGYKEYTPPPPVINKNAGLISITASPAQLKRVRQYLNDLKSSMQRQVLLSVSISSVSLNKSHQRGINWDNFSSFISSNLKGKSSSIGYENLGSGKHGLLLNLGIAANLNISTVLDFLERQGKTKVLSQPKLLVSNEQQAIFQVGDTINYQTKESSKGTETGATVTETNNNFQIFVGIMLNIRPAISEDGELTLRISPSLSDFKYPQDRLHQQKPRTIAPDTVSKKLSTVVHLKDGQTLILGGLITKSLQLEESELKGLAKIPILGWFFKGQNYRYATEEIVFIIKPKLVKPF